MLGVASWAHHSSQNLALYERSWNLPNESVELGSLETLLNSVMMYHIMYIYTCTCMYMPSMVAPVEFIPRMGKLGLGAAPKPKPMPDKKRPRKPGDTADKVPHTHARTHVKSELVHLLTGLKCFASSSNDQSCQAAELLW